VQAEIIELMRALCAERGTAILMISHDLGLVRQCLPRVGRHVCRSHRRGRGSDDIFRASAHPYTQGWSTRCRGSAAAPPLATRLTEIAGVVPAITNFPNGCRFNPRCAQGNRNLPHHRAGADLPRCRRPRQVSSHA